ncbi:PIR Superfamily Protein [Plasmodium ovale wallikeri]|uniref:PIR Superfamily Protein n=1 Tax=Plasmodium ovale wallikeri TaxID=864142 RepID=A0A1A9AHW1_PLAOA|nr:PIR Superfamily Protein [Plasmodium ovale wallikeri]SBT55747.1 PIR Superfamily Protein [Plasmodium ovale wallikeri]
MSNLKDDFSYDEFKEKNDILQKLIFDKIYKKFNDDYKTDINVGSYCNQFKGKLSYPYNDEALTLHFCNILYKILANVKILQNDLYDEITKDDNIYCISLKYWLYEKIGNRNPKVSSIDKHFQSWKNKLENEINVKLSVPCELYELDWNDMNKLRKIYAFALIYYSNLDIFKTNYHIECEFFDYLGKGLKEYYESLIECSNGNKSHEFCKELYEFQKIYKLDDIYWKNSTLNTGYIYDSYSTDDCPLVIESLQNPLRIKYREENNTLYLSNEPIDFQKSTIISASSAMGATLGISAFLLYLFKYTSFGSLFGTRAEKDNTMFLNVNEGTHDFTFPNSELEQTNFGNNEYKITYYSVGNS